MGWSQVGLAASKSGARPKGFSADSLSCPAKTLPFPIVCTPVPSPNNASLSFLNSVASSAKLGGIGRLFTGQHCSVLYKAVNRSRLPAITVPCGFTPKDLPAGLQIAGTELLRGYDLSAGACLPAGKEVYCAQTSDFT